MAAPGKAAATPPTPEAHPCAESWPPYPCSPSPSSGNNGQLANSRFTNNMLYGGVFSVYLYGTGLTITGNRFATNPWHSPGDGNTYNGWVYGASDVTCSTVTWADNKAVTMDSNWQPNTAGTALNCA